MDTGRIQVVVDFVKSKVTSEDHQMIYVHSLNHYCIYNNKTNQAVVCDLLESLGFSCRVGIRHRYYLRQGLQEYVFEISKTTKFSHRFTDEYNHEILENSNDAPK